MATASPSSITRNPNYYTFSTYDEEVAWLKKFAESRLNWLELQFLPAPTMAAGTEGARVVLRAKTGEIYYTLDGADPRASGGGVSKAAQLYQSELRSLPGATFFARAREGDRWSAPLLWTN